MLTITWQKIKSALVTALLTAILAIAGYIVGVGDIFKIDVRSLANIGALTALTSIISLIKSFLTSDAGNFVGVLKIAPEKDLSA